MQALFIIKLDIPFQKIQSTLSYIVTETLLKHADTLLTDS